MTTHVKPFTRRRFLKGMMAAGLFAALPSALVCCSGAEKQPSTLAWVEALASTLLPGQPDMMQIGFLHYYAWVMADPYFDADIKRMIRMGLAEFRRFCGARSFPRLKERERENILSDYLDEYPSATSWLGLFMRLIWEAALLDPYYGVNKDEAGWKWLHHHPGKPRPVKGSSYSELLALRTQSEIIRSLRDLENFE